MAIGYYGIKLSDNVVETPEGYLVFKNAVIARTGFYVYKGSELLADKITARELEEQGVVIDHSANVQIYRSPEEVFSKRSIDSFQGKPVTDGHPPQMLDLESVVEHECGQVFNVREGKEPLEDGNMPLLGDIIVKSKDLINKWKAGLRELSNGYNYHIVKIGEVLAQVDIVGNHVAFVENGRAGIYARVNDSKPTTEKFNMSNFLKDIRKRGFLAWATDAQTKPEQLAAAFDEMAEADKPKAADEDKHPEGCRCADCKGGAKDAKANDRERFHKALDKHLDAKDAMAEEQAAVEDADMNELKEMFSAKGKEEMDPEDDIAEKEEESGATDEKEEDDGEAEDGLDDIAAPVIAPADRQQKDTPSATDAAYRAGAEAVLKSLKPFVARAKHKSLTGAFDTASKLVKGTGWKGAASYSGVAAAAGKANDSAIISGQDAVTKQAEAAEASYAASRKAKLARK